MKTIYTLTLYLILTSPLLADGNVAEGEPLHASLRDATDAAVAHNPAIAAAVTKWQAAKERITQEAAWEDLKVSGTSRAARFVDVPPNAFTDQMLSVEQTIPLAGKNRARARIAAQDALIAYEQARRVQLDVITKTRVAFFKLANAYAQLDLNRKNLTSLRQIAEVSRSRYEVGKENAAVALGAEVEASKLLESEQDIRRNISAEESQLNVLMNRDAFSGVGIPEQITPKPLRNSIQQLREVMKAQRPEIRIATAKAAAEKSRVELARRNWIPEPAVTVQAQRYNDSAQAASEVDAGISFSIPWSNPRKYSAGIRETKANLAAAEHGLDQASSEAIGALRDAIQKVHTAEHHFELFRDKLVPQAQQAFGAGQLGYESGTSTFQDWIGAQHNLREIEAMAREHLTDYVAALAELESLVGADLKIFPTVSTQQQESK